MDDFGAVDILLVEDSDPDAEMTTRALRKGGLVNRLVRVRDGVEALEFVFREGPWSTRGSTQPNPRVDAGVDPDLRVAVVVSPQPRASSLVSAFGGSATSALEPSLMSATSLTAESANMAVRFISAALEE